MKPELALARTVARGGRYEAWTPSGGTVSFTPQDAAAALAGAPRLGGRLLLVKYGCGTANDIRDIAIELGFEVANLAEAPRDTSIAGISIMLGVVTEVLAPIICDRCDGRGWVSVDARWEPCIPCEGTGRGTWSLTRRANECGVDRKVLRTTAWGRIYEAARRLLVQDELAALDHMARRLRNGRR